MTTRAERLKRLVRLQDQIRTLHETRQAIHASNAISAGREAADLLDALNAPSSLPGLFPDLYNRRIGRAIDRQERSEELARHEAGGAAAATARVRIVARAYREAQRLQDRHDAEKEQLEAVERAPAERK